MKTFTFKSIIILILIAMSIVSATICILYADYISAIRCGTVTLLLAYLVKVAYND